MANKTALRGNNFKILISQRMLDLLNGSIELFMSKDMTNTLQSKIYFNLLPKAFHIQYE